VPGYIFSRDSKSESRQPGSDETPTARRRFYGQNVRKVRERRMAYIVIVSMHLCLSLLLSCMQGCEVLRSARLCVCLSVGLSACVSQNTRRLNFIKLLCMLLVAVARSSYDENAIRYVGLLPVFIRHNCDANLRTGQTQ